MGWYQRRVHGMLQVGADRSRYEEIKQIILRVYPQDPTVRIGFAGGGATSGAPATASTPPALTWATATNAPGGAATDWLGSYQSSGGNSWPSEVASTVGPSASELAQP